MADPPPEHRPEGQSHDAGRQRNAPDADGRSGAAFFREMRSYLVLGVLERRSSHDQAEDTRRGRRGGPKTQQRGTTGRVFG